MTMRQESDVTASYMIGMFDVLGFEKRVQRIGLDRIYGEYKELLDAVGRRDSRLLVAALPTAENPSVCVAALGSHILEHAYFSDTILVWSNYDRVRADSFLSICADLICESILLRLPLRGALAVGPAKMEPAEGVFLGTPIIEVAHVEREQNWIGVSLGPSLHAQQHSFDGRLVIPYRRHLKPGATWARTLVVDWPRYWRDNRSEDLLSLLHRMRPRGDGREKYDMTIAFVRYSDANSEWWRSQDPHLEGY